MERALIIGGTGSLGHRLVGESIKSIIFSRDELKQWEMQRKFSNAEFIIGDVRDKFSIIKAIEKYKPTEIIIASALKHVDVCENNPGESIKTNLMGTQNVVDAVFEAKHNTEKVLLVSTDKACAPVNVYGMCKALSERVMIEASNRDSLTKFMTVRYGNVVNSRGSIIPLLQSQSKTSEPYLITNDKMTRFLMTLNESVDLINDILEHGKSGEVWVPRLRSAYIIDIINIFATIYDKEIKNIGIRQGEKIDEDLINITESLRTKITSKNYIITPETGFRDEPFKYTSASSPMSREDTEIFLNNCGELNNA